MIRVIHVAVIFSALAGCGAGFAGSEPLGASQRAGRAGGLQGAAGPKRWLRKAGRILAAVGLGAGLALVLVLALEDRFIFFPEPAPLDGWEPPGLGVERCFITTADGVRLHAWWHRGGPDEAPRRTVLLWFHGNAGNISHRADNLRMLADRGLALLLVDYRGYGASEGKPSERELYLDGEAAYRYLVEERGIEPGRIVCFGRSLGAAVALHVALDAEVAGLIMESPFANIPAMARANPVLRLAAALARNRFDSLGRVGRLQVPLLIIHGERDRVVPIAQGRAIFEAAPEPKRFHVLEQAGHNDTYLAGGPDYWRAFTEFCAGCTGAGR
jgi:fermentation-respiration switch protein FrsA (DUF1100 family)